MPKIEGIGSIGTTLRRLARGQKYRDVIVGYTAAYALYVHEDLEAHHPVGQAKYLEQPAREMRKELAVIVQKVVKAGGTLEQGLLIAGLRLQRASQMLVPVDTGNLKASAFTRIEG